MCRPPSSDRVRWRACGLPYPASGRRSRPSIALHVCFLTGVPRHRRPGRCSPFHAPIPPRRWLTVQRCPPGGGEAVIPRLVVRGPMAVALPRSRSPRTLHPGCFWARHCRLCWSSSGADGVPSSAGNGAGSGRWHPLRAPASDPTPITQVKVRTRAKSITGFSLSKPVPGFKTGYQFSGSCLTSLVTTLLIVSEDMIYAVDLVLDHLQLCL